MEEPNLSWEDENKNKSGGVIKLILLAILGLIGFGLYYVSAVALVIYAVVAIIALFILCLAFSGAYSTFTSTVLTFTYLKLSTKD